MNKIVVLCIILLLAIGLPFFINIKPFIEGYSNFTLDAAMGDLQPKLLVQDTYPPIGKNEISNDDANDIWQYYPIFELGSYAQTTNNIRYPDNPDEGTCMPASMCGALYHDKKFNVEPLPPVNSDCGTRIGYFGTNERLIDSLPYKTTINNIL
jgi:hypothetical protein